jgi:hypothetical protein
MLKELPYTKFLEWQEFDKIEPIGGLRGDWHAASICSMLVNTMAMRAGVKARTSPKDFLLEWKDASEVKEVVKEKQPQGTPWQTMKMYARMHAAQANADEKRKQKRKR